MSEEIEVVAYVGCESRMTQDGHENGDEYLVFADTASDADKRYNVPLMTVAQCRRLLAAKDAELEQCKRDAERMREALKPFAECADQIEQDEDDEEWAKFRLLVKDYRAAYAALSAQPDHSGEVNKIVKPEPVEIPSVWSKSLSSCWPEDDQYPEQNWIIGTIDEDGNKYPVITVEAYQYDAEGHSEQIAKVISALWKSAAQQQSEVKP